MNDVSPTAVAGAQSQQLVEHLAQLTLDRLDTSVVREARPPIRAAKIKLRRNSAV